MHTELLLVSDSEATHAHRWLEQHAGQLGFDLGARTLGSGEELLAEGDAEHAQVVALTPDQAVDLAPKVGEALDKVQLLRWPVFIIEATEDLDRVALQVKHAITDHGHRREIGRLRADLKAVARRVNHDLRSPIGGITTTAELLKELLGDSAPDLVSLTEPFFDSTQAMVKLVDRVSFISRATAEPLPKEAVNMSEVVWAAEQRLQRNLMKAGVTLSHPESWPEVEGVIPWLEVMWWNLLINAIEHSNKEGTVEVYWEAAGDAVRFGVKDLGKGVAEAKRKSLFQPFHLLHLPNSPHGLGLPIVRRLAELQQGGWGCEFPESGGSVFYFELPQKKA